MAVYTQLTQSEIESFLAQYDVGTLVSFKPIAEGVTNSNYLLVASHQSATTQYILTLFEKRYRLEDLPYFTHLMQWWSDRGIACPKPISMRQGGVLAALKEKPAILVSFLEGHSTHKITLEHMAMLGKLTAQMHVAGMGFPHVRANGLSVSGWEKLVDDIGQRAEEIELDLTQLIREEYNELSEHWPSDLPSGPVHADLFPDNVFFEKTFGKPPQLSGVIDFYFACNDFWAYDLAICVNAWCFDERHRLVKERVETLMQHYNDIRPMTDEEEAAFPLLLRGAALRFLLTRTYDALNPEPGAVLTLKDPLEYVAKLTFFKNFAV